MAAPLNGLRVVEFSNGLTSAQIGQHLADFGAEVAMIERPGGSSLRRAAGFPFWARGKQSIVLDLKAAADLATARGLCERADVVVECWRDGVADRVGVGYESLAEVNPGLVYASVTGFPLQGPYHGVKGYEALVVAALGGNTAVQRSVARAGPAFITVPAGSHGTAHLVLHGILAALHERRRSGLGQHVRSSLTDGFASYDTFAWFVHLYQLRYPDAFAPAQSFDDDGTPNSHLQFCLLVAQTSDGHWLQFSQVTPRLFWAMIGALGLDWIRDDPRWAGAPYFEAKQGRLDFYKLLQATVKAMSLADVEAMLAREPDVWAELYREGNDLMRHPQILHDHQIVTIDDPERGAVRQLGPVARLSATPASLGTAPPRLDEHGAALRARLAETPVRAQPVPVAPHPPRPALDGVTVLELGSFFAAAYGPTILADYGARVLKIEPLEGEPLRAMLPVPELGGGKVLQGKESVALDLAKPEAREIVLELARRSDLVLCTWRAGVAARLGLGRGDLLAVNPRLFYCESPGYGVDGPCGSRPAFAPTIGAGAGMAWRNAGVTVGDRADLDTDEIRMAAVRLASSNSTNFVNSDGIAANAVATALLLGLAARDEGAPGQGGLTTMLNSNGHCLGDDMVEWAGRPPAPNADPHLYGLGARYRLYETADGWGCLAAPQESEWPPLVAALAPHLDLAADARFATEDARQANDPALADALAAVFATRPARAWEAELLAYDVGFVVVAAQLSEQILMSDAFGRAWGLVCDRVSAVFGEYPRLVSHVRFSRSPTTEGPTPAIGEHTDAVLRELGYDDDRIAALRENDVIG